MKIIDNRQVQEIGSFGAKDDSRKMGSSFFRGEHCNFNPYREDRANPDFIENYVGKGWAPSQPIIDRSTRITAFGSCFAENISAYLSAKGYALTRSDEPEIYVSRIGEGLVNTYAILQQFEWAWLGKRYANDLWHGWKGESFDYDEEIRLKTKAAFERTDLFIITLGLSEVWYDSVTGEVFWRAIPVKAYDPNRHKFRVATAAENSANLLRIIDLIAEFRPSAKVLVTVSPIPLAATFRPVAALTANAVSKSNLRAAVDEAFTQRENEIGKRLFYFPSYEIVHEFPFRFEEDSRHVYDYILDANMRIFEAFYCAGDVTKVDANRVFQAALLRNLTEAPQELSAALTKNLAEGPAAPALSTTTKKKRARGLTGLIASAFVKN